MVMKRALQELRAHLWQQKGPNTAGLTNNIRRAFGKARSTASAEEKEQLDWFEGEYGQDVGLVNTYHAIEALDKIIKKHNCILWIARRHEWEEKINGSIQKGSGLVYRAIKEHVTGEVPVTKEGHFGTKEIVAEQAQIWAGWWKSDSSTNWQDFKGEGVTLP